MTKFLIEVAHDGSAVACARAQRELLGSGLHYLTHADWGCRDGVHAAWLIVESETRGEARGILPPADRPRARVVALTDFSGALAEHRTENG